MHLTIEVCRFRQVFVADNVLFDGYVANKFTVVLISEDL